MVEGDYYINANRDEQQEGHGSGCPSMNHRTDTKKGKPSSRTPSPKNIMKTFHPYSHIQRDQLLSRMTGIEVTFLYV